MQEEWAVMKGNVFQRGKASIAFEEGPLIIGCASVAGKKEGEGPLKRCFDYISPDAWFGEKSWEKAESTMLRKCFSIACDKAALEHMRQAFAEEPRLRAVGEIGLDFYWDDCPKELQYQAFQQQLDLARELAKPVVIHCRNAEEEALALLEARSFADYPLLWHCFGGAPALARRIVRNGWHLSIPGPVSYPANAALREAVAVIPDDRLLLETDSPYLSPVPWRGKRNEPAFTVFTVRQMAEARGVSPEELWQLCGDNARRFFGLE